MAGDMASTHIPVSLVVTYTAALCQGKPPEESEVTVILPNGKKQVRLYEKGEEALVCGDVVYLPPDNPRYVR